MRIICQQSLSLKRGIHLSLDHRISLSLVSEMCKQPDTDVRHCETAKQKGDLMTKGLARPKHEPAMKMVGLYPIIVFDWDGEI